jgi:hypothetical protein
LDLQAEEGTLALDTMKAVFLYVIQLLYRASKHRPNQLVETAMTTTSRPIDWAHGEAEKYGVATHGGSGTAEELNCGVTNIGSTLHQWTKVMRKHNELDAKKDKKVREQKVDLKN